MGVSTKLTPLNLGVSVSVGVGVGVKTLFGRGVRCEDALGSGGGGASNGYIFCR